ncbi:hypothetical protein C5467_15570 [Photorhabdus khanii subsp. guanajuatensis]|uniref:N-acetyltransferase n=1 Tax=Photorhabdus khanii subsp. guanajuatensis TaxID=2100166 RepID=A0A4R4JG48_9GAMM|nr:hypothetical protein C5467_15570 [Photorhabdus khanii subsp. guanajuatensis]
MIIINCGIRDVTTGDNVRVMVPANIYECELHDDVFVGPFVEIQRGCVIGRGSRVQSHTFICENVSLGANISKCHNQHWRGES